MSTANRVHNSGPKELVYTEDGRILEGFKSVECDPTDRVTARLIAAGRLIVLQQPAPASKPAKRSASKAQLIENPPSTTEGA